MPEKPVLAYLTSFYPHATDTFIRHEVRALRDMGFAVHTFSVRRPPTGMVVSDDIRAEREQTLYLAESLPRLLLAGLWGLLWWPMRMFRAAALAYRSNNKGLRARLWQTAYLLEAALLARHLRSLKIDHLHNHIGENSATVAMLASALSGVPYSMTVHGPGDFDHPISIDLGRKIQHAAFVVAVTQFGRSQLYRWCNHEHWRKINVVHCGVNGIFLERGPQPIVDRPRFACVGRLCEAKGQLLLVDAAARLAAEGHRFEVVFVGDGPMRGQIEKLIDRHTLRDSVTITGWASSDRVRYEVLASRAMVLPSFAEGLPVVIMEALALGRPVISTYIAGIPELVQPGRCGWLVPAGSVDALVDAMRQALQATPQQLEQMGRAGAQLVAQRHNIHTEAAKLAELFVQSAPCSPASSTSSF